MTAACRMLPPVCRQTGLPLMSYPPAGMSTIVQTPDVAGKPAASGSSDSGIFDRITLIGMMHTECVSDGAAPTVSETRPQLY